MEIKELAGQTQGVSYGRRIALSPNAGTKTLIHELAHEMMHQRDGERLSSSLMELEAEAVGYVVAKHFGLDGLACPSYISLQGADSTKILEHMERIRNTATQLITAVESSIS